MTDFNAELAWDIQEWSTQVTGNEELSRDQVTALTGFLAAKGYRKGDEIGKPLVASLAYVEEIGKTISEKYLPVVDALAKKYFPKEKSDQTSP